MAVGAVALLVLFAVACTTPTLLAAQNESPTASKAKPADSPPNTTTPPAKAAPPAESPKPKGSAESKPDAPSAAPHPSAAPKKSNEVHPVFKINKPLITDDQIKEFKSKDSSYKNAMRTGTLDRELIAEGIKTRIFSLTRFRNETQKEKDDGAKLVETIRREIFSAGQQLPDAPKKTFREFVLQNVTNRCAELLDNQFYSRMQAVVLLSNLNLIEPEGQTPVVAYTPALDPLQKALDEPNQIIAIKVVAVVGMTRINLHAATPPTPNQRINMANSLIRELGNPTDHDWYQARLLAGLSSIEQVNDLGGKPFIINTIQSVLNDRNRPWLARTAAAKALGRAQLTPDMKVNVFVVDIINLAREVAEAINNEPATKSPFWGYCLFDIYCAFKPAPENVVSGDAARGAGLINKVGQASLRQYETIVKEGYNRYLPLFNHVLSANAIANVPETLITPLREWVQANAPPDYPGLPVNKQASQSPNPKVRGEN